METLTKEPRYLKTPKYKSGRDFYKTAHEIKNSDMCKLYEFFNPKPNQVFISGSILVCGDRVPKLLESLLYKVEYEGDFWKVRIPENLQYTPASSTS